MFKDAPMGSPMFHLYNVLYLTFFTGLMTFGMLFVYYITYEAPNPAKDVENMLGRTASQYEVIQDNLTLSSIQNSNSPDKALLESYFTGSEIDRFYVTDINTGNLYMIVYSVTSGGFAGPVRSLVGIGDNEVRALEVTDASVETAGLGQRIAEKGFALQFINKTAGDMPSDRTEWTPNGLNMISGATFSSMAVVNNIKKALELYKYEGGN